jgi:hypothetical protein
VQQQRQHARLGHALAARLAEATVLETMSRVTLPTAEYEALASRCLMAGVI